MGILANLGLETEFERFKREKLGRNMGMYTWASSKQREVVEGYMKFRTRNAYERACARSGRNVALKVSQKKVDALKKLCGDIDDFKYSGCVDLGEIGAGHCSLGHALRYMHTARSESTGVEIAFGSKCASDFFEVSEWVMKELKDTQERLVEELKIIPFIMAGGEERIKKFSSAYRDFDELTERFGESVAVDAMGDFYYIMRSFNEAFIPWTTYMIGVWRNARYKRYETLMRDSERADAARALVGDDHELREQLCEVNKHIEVHYVRLVNSYLADFHTKTGGAAHGTGGVLSGLEDISDDIGVCRRLIGTAYKCLRLVDICAGLAERFTGGSKDASAAKVAKYLRWAATRSITQAYVVCTTEKKHSMKLSTADEGVRLATKNEVAALSDRLRVANHFAIGPAKSCALNLIAWAFNGERLQYERSGLCTDAESVSEMSKLVDSMDAMEIALRWSVDGCSKFIEDMEELGKSYVEYLDTADGDISRPTNPVSVAEMLNYIWDNKAELGNVCDKLPGERKADTRYRLKIALDIHGRVEKYGIHSVTLRQSLLVRDTYKDALKLLGDDKFVDDAAYGADDLAGVEGAGELEEQKEYTVEELVVMAKKVVDMDKRCPQHMRAKYPGLSKKYEFHRNVCATIATKTVQYGRPHVSDKQKKYVIEVYQAMLAGSDRGQQKGKVNISGASGAAGASATGNTVDILPHGSVDNQDATNSKDYGLTGLPTVTSISNALGLGKFV